MSHHFGVLFVLMSFFLGGYLSESTIDVKDLIPSKCRIAGVALVENQDRSKIFNYTMAESACQVLGLQLANKEQMEKARGYGYETCSFGWISEKVGAIPRIQGNINCGRNKTGVVTWWVELSKPFVSTYCFNVSDVQVNSCKPGLMVTEPPSTVVVPTSGSTTVSTSLKTETQTESTLASMTHAMTTEATTKLLYTTLIPTSARTSRSTTLQTTPSEDTEPPIKQESQVHPRTERPIFGGLPTTLLILALVFFVAALALAVCYIKKYKTHLLFTTKKHKKESVETKVFKDASGAETMKEDDRYTNLQETESLQKFTGNSIEAEV
ncbi:lymphatic vessel endothelial hyaluronic acid receptor 1 [Dendropsophus ebraccatus]|uniref:lymphatic vessel endothelial hyaluronic acid receptor 1 n=1 Tax=Dendropsophus ebraccatus TaxID=150705 RepID=UPI003831BEEF